MKKLGLLALAFSTACAAAHAQQTTLCSAVPSHMLSAEDLLRLAKIPDKGEYETSAAYSSRIAKAFGGGPVGVSVPLSGDLGSYDADSQTLSIPEYALPLAEKITSAGFTGWIAPVYDKRKVTGRYVGQNGFGAKTIVSREEEASIGIAWLRETGPYFNPDKDWQISLSAAEARVTRKNLRVLLVGTLAAPYVARASDLDEATMNDPTELTTDQVGIVVAPVCAAVYDRRTGHVLTSWEASNSPKTGFLP